MDPVRDGVAAVAAHDGEALARATCPARRSTSPFIVQGIGFAVDGLDGDAGLDLITFDASRVEISELERDGDTAIVRLAGVLVERVDPDAWERAYRAAAAARGEAADEAWVGEIRGRIGDGTVELPLDQNVRVVLAGGAWQICEPEPSP